MPNVLIIFKKPTAPEGSSQVTLEPIDFLITVDPPTLEANITEDHEIL